MARPFCDIIMKGGVTSGIVYPKAIARLARDFTFRNIGGTSAGAIAACLTAAAEYRRKEPDGEAAFDGVGKLADELNERIGGHSRLYSLFQPERATRHLFGLATSFMGGDGWLLKLGRLLGHLLLAFWWEILLTLVPLRWILPQLRASNPIATAAERTLVVLAALTLFALLSIVWTLCWTLPRQRFGLCTGGTRSDTPGLMEWLDARINATAGVNEPLTFAQLAKREVNLRMVTTNLTHGRPYTIPFRQHVPFFFDRAEFERIFPRNVVEALVRSSDAFTSAAPEGSNAHLAGTLAKSTGRYLLPPPEELPIVVAARMSLSFPLLFSVVPLCSIDFGKEKDAPSLPYHREPDLCWFIDGGLTSNFPISLFDSPLPRWPTFGLDLMEVAKVPEDEPVWMIERDQDGRSEHWNRFAPAPDRVGAGGWLGAMLDTIRNWRDNIQMGTTGYRDRIAHIKLTGREGGLNLEMAETTISDLAKRGEAAGELLARRFVPGSAEPMNWQHHQKTRYRISMTLLERMIDQIRRALDGPSNGSGYLDGIAAWQESRKWVDRTNALVSLRDSWSKALPPDYEEDAPSPMPELHQSPPF